MVKLSAKKAICLIIAAIALLACLLVAGRDKITADSSNLIDNPSVETVSSGNVNLPQNWLQGRWGTNTTTFTYANTGHNGSRSIRIDMTSRTSGDAKWYFKPVTVQPNTSYNFSEYYQSSIPSEIDIQFTDSSGNLSYKVLKSPAPSPSGWTQFNGSFITPATAKSLTVFHLIYGVGWLQTDDYSLTLTNPAPSVDITAPLNGATVSATVNLAANAASASGISGVQFTVDGSNIGGRVNAVPYQTTWDSSSVANGTHQIGAIAYANDGQQTTSVPVNVTVSNALPAPTVNITSPSDGATVSNTINISADSSSPAGIANVQFKLDNQNIGSQLTSAPYQIAWNTANASNGSHQLTAVASANDGQQTTSAPISVTVSNNVQPPPSNLIPNPSVETASGSSPQDWSHSKWGSNTTSFTYITNDGRTGGHSLKVQTTRYSSGAANWNFTPVTVSGGTTYDYKDYYKSNAVTEIDAEINLSDGTTSYQYLGAVYPDQNNWTKFEAQFSVPANAVSVTIDHILYSVGWLQTDDFSLTPYASVGFNRPLISLTFDDGYASFYNNGLPLLRNYGFNSTDFIISSYINNNPNYMTSAMLQNLVALGNEIGSHTISHPDLTSLDITSLDNQLGQSQAALQAWVGVPVTDFASPYGAYNQTVLNVIQNYYRSHRSVDKGFNAKSNFDIYNIKVQSMLVTTPLSQVQAWVDQALRDSAASRSSYN